MGRELQPGATEILVEVFVAAPDQDVMRALTHPEALSCWMQSRIDFRAEIGAPFRIEWEDPAFPGSITGNVVDLNPNRRIVLSWNSPGRDLATQVTISAAPATGGTSVKLSHAGFPAGPDWTGPRDLVRADWEKSLTNLRFFVEEGGLSRAPAYIRRSVGLAAPAERAYQVWSDRDHLVAWWLRDARIDLREGAPQRFVLQDGTAIDGRLLLLQKHRHIRWVWQEGRTRTMVGVSFWPLETGSRVSLTQVGFGLAEADRRRYETEWDRCLQELARYVG